MRGNWKALLVWREVPLNAVTKVPGWTRMMTTWPVDAANMEYYVTTIFSVDTGAGVCVCVCCTNVCGPRKISSLYNRK